MHMICNCVEIPDWNFQFFQSRVVFLDISSQNMRHFGLSSSTVCGFCVCNFIVVQDYTEIKNYLLSLPKEICKVCLKFSALILLESASTYTKCPNKAGGHFLLHKCKMSAASIRHTCINQGMLTDMQFLSCGLEPTTQGWMLQKAAEHSVTCPAGR